MTSFAGGGPSAIPLLGIGGGLASFGANKPQNYYAESPPSGEDFVVSAAGLGEVNGCYKKQENNYKYNSYKNGKYFLWRGSAFVGGWGMVNVGWFISTSIEGGDIAYYVSSLSSTPPLVGWKCTSKCTGIEPVPILNVSTC